MSIKIGFPDIPLDALKIEHTNQFGDSNRLREFNNTISGKKNTLARLNTASSFARVNYDLASKTKSVNYLGIARADLLSSSGGKSIRLRGSRQGAFTPSKYGNLIAWYDATRSTTLDSDGLISQIDDLSGNNFHATQGTAANRPRLTRADNQENVVTYSEQFTTAAWDDTTTYGVNTTDNFIADYSGSITAAKITPFAGAAARGIFYGGISYIRFLRVLVGQIYIIEIDVKKGNYDYAFIGDRSDSIWHGINVNLATGAFIGSGNGITSKSITSLGDSWYRVSLTCTASSTFFPSVGVWFGRNVDDPAPTNLISFAGTEEIYIARAQIRRNATDTTYIITTTTPQFAGIAGNRSIYFDGTTDHLDASTAAPSFSGNDIPISAMIAFKVRTLKNFGTFFSLNRTSSGNPYNYVYYSTSQIGSFRMDDAGTNNSRLAGSLNNNVNILSYVFNGTNLSAYLNGVIFMNNLAHNVGTVTFDRLFLGAIKAGTGAIADYFEGQIGEAIFYNDALDSTERANLEQYLADKWQAEPIIYSNDLSSETLEDGDLIKTSATSTAYRHFCLEYESESTSKFTHSKIFSGEFIDCSTKVSECITIKENEGLGGIVNDLGNADLSRGAQPRHIVTIEYTGLTDAELKEFKESIQDRAVLHNSFFLYAGSDTEALRGKKSIYAMLEEFTVIAREKADYNNIRLRFIEDLG